MPTVTVRNMKKVNQDATNLSMFLHQEFVKTNYHFEIDIQNDGDSFVLRIFSNFLAKSTVFNAIILKEDINNHVIIAQRIHKVLS